MRLVKVPRSRESAFLPLGQLEVSPSAAKHRAFQTDGSRQESAFGDGDDLGRHGGVRGASTASRSSCGDPSAT